MLQKIVDQLNEEVKCLNSIEALEFIADKFKNKIIFTTSFGYEDQVISDMIFKNDIDIDVVTLDTGRLFKETYKVYSQTLDTYKKVITLYYPEKDKVEKMMTEKGPFSFYNSIENRQQCCNIRKVEPLNRALQGIELWITGMRADQSPNREGMTFFELDDARQIIKYNPLLSFSLNDVKEYVKKNHVPYNVLHDQKFVSIGCEPCTRAINEGDDFRAGRWWWESDSKKECGLHTH